MQHRRKFLVKLIRNGRSMMGVQSLLMLLNDLLIALTSSVSKCIRVVVQPIGPVVESNSSFLFSLFPTIPICLSNQITTCRWVWSAYSVLNVIDYKVIRWWWNNAASGNFRTSVTWEDFTVLLSAEKNKRRCKKKLYTSLTSQTKPRSTASLIEKIDQVCCTTHV